MTDPILRADRIRDRELNRDIDAEQDRRDAPDHSQVEVHDRLRAVLTAPISTVTGYRPVRFDLLTEAADLLEHYYAADYESRIRDLEMALETAQKARAAAERAFSKVSDAVNEARKDWRKA